jgi:hypothetical protein
MLKEARQFDKKKKKTKELKQSRTVHKLERSYSPERQRRSIWVFLAGPAHDSRGSSIGTIHLAFTLPSALLFLFFLGLNHHPSSSLITLPCPLTLRRLSRVLDGFAVIGTMGISTVEYQSIY